MDGVAARNEPHDRGTGGEKKCATLCRRNFVESPPTESNKSCYTTRNCRNVRSDVEIRTPEETFRGVVERNGGENASSQAPTNEQ
jgi:hypothetical protein